VIGSTGKLSGYRWGIERKATLLEKESEGAQGLTDSAPPNDRISACVKDRYR